MNKDTFLNELEKRLRVIDWQERKEILNSFDEEMIENINNVNKENIIEVAKKMKLRVNYFLGN